jgi:septal ring factor EnvC (AmiA/AmiB activator)
MSKTSQLKARLRSAQAELAIRTRTYNSAARAFEKVKAHIAELEKKIEDVTKIQPGVK